MRARDFLDKAANETKMAGGIMRTLREFIEKRKTNREIDDLNTIVEETVVLGMAGSAEVKAMLRKKLTPGLPAIRVDRIQIQQVVLNLVRNAVDAMADSARRELVVATGLDEPGFVCVTVSDTARHRAGRHGEAVPALRHHEGERHGRGLDDLPVDRRSA